MNLFGRKISDNKFAFYWFGGIAIILALTVRDLNDVVAFLEGLGVAVLFWVVLLLLFGIYALTKWAFTSIVSSRSRK